MDTNLPGSPEALNPAILKQLKLELNALDNDPVEIDGSRIKPSQCYRFEVDPVHVMFNTNCPDSLKQKVEAILSKHLKPDESSTSK